jgi:hypothetical protein
MIRNLNPFLYLAVCVFTLLLSAQALSADSPDYVALAKAGLTEMDETDMGEDWFFTVTAQTDEETLVSRNDPSKEEEARRELLSVNGEPPTEKRLKEFDKQEAKRQKSRKDDDNRTKFSAMVDYSTLALTEVTNGQAILSFSPILDGLEKESDKMDGTLRLNADTYAIEELSLANTEKISPAFSVSFTTFTMSFSFSPVDGETLMSGMGTSIEGKVGFLKKINTRTEIEFSDYQRWSE